MTDVKKKKSVPELLADTFTAALHPNQHRKICIFTEKKLSILLRMQRKTIYPELLQ